MFNKLTYFMKRIYKIALAVCVLSAGLFACSDQFLDRPLAGATDASALANQKGVDAVLIGAYSALDGWTEDWSGGAVWTSAGSNWVFGSILGGDATKGSDAGDQPSITPIEKYAPSTENEYFVGKWRVSYDGVARSNSVIQLANAAGDIPADKKARIIAEARFLRGFYHFEAKRMWNNIPYIDDAVTNFRVPNDKDAWAPITADLKAAADALPEAMPNVGRVNKWAAKAYLAKALMYQGKFAEALPILNDVISNGKTPVGTKYGLNDCFHDNFRVSLKNSKESVFAAQCSVNDGTEGANGNYGDVLNTPYGGGAPGECCGFFQPSNSLVNSYKVDAKGLPLFDTFDDVDMKNDQGIDVKAPFTPYDGTVDPRLDWTVGRRGIPYLDWGKHPGVSWIRDQAYSGPYSPKKNLFYKAEKGTNSTASGWAQGPSALNINLMRFADILLLAAEAEVEAGSLTKAQEYVNMIRKRAGSCMVMDEDKPAANYKVATYTGTWTDKNAARIAVRFERKLELAMEGHRFFDLVRWGIADVELNKYLEKAQTRRNYLAGAKFTKGKSEYLPIPFSEVVKSSVDGTPTLKQNPGY